MEKQYYQAIVRKLSYKIMLGLCLMSFSLSASAFSCSIFEGATHDIPSFKTEIAELQNMENSGRHIKVLVPVRGPVQEFNLAQYIHDGLTQSEISKKLQLVKGGTVVYIDLFPIEKRYEIRIGLLTTNLDQVIKPSVYANFSYNSQHNEVYDLQNKIAVFCNWEPGQVSSKS